MKARSMLSIAALGAFLSGCTPTDSADGGMPGGSSGTPTTIRSFAITDTSGTLTSGGSTAVFDAAKNGGTFKLAHDAVSSTQPYRAEWYVSSDTLLSSDDKLILGRNCDHGLGDCPNQAASFTCTYTSDVKTVCAGGVDSDTTELSSYFASQRGLPGNYTVIFRACDGLFSDCQIRTVPAEFH